MRTESLLFSVRPYYAELVFRGIKRVELRKRGIPRRIDCDVFVYVSSPDRQLRGGFRIDSVLSGHPSEIWSEVSEVACIKKPDYDAYYQGHTIAYALQISDVWEHKYPLELDTLRGEIEDFRVPQSWRYVTEKEYDLFQTMKRQSLEL